MANLGNAYVNIVPKAPGIEKEIETLIGKGSKGAGAPGKITGSSFLGGLKSVITTAAVGAIVKTAFSAGGDLQQSFGGLDTIYGDAAAGAKELAKEAALSGISMNSYAEQAVSFGAALKAAYGGDTAAAANAANTAILDMADNAAKMGTPLESIQTAYQGFARGQYQLLDNLKLGYGGTKTEMERLLKDAQAITGVKYDISNLGDVYNAIHVIQNELGLTGVAAHEAQTTLTGSFNALSASWTNVMAAMTTGEGLEEAMENLSTSAGYFANNVLNMLGSLAPQIPSFVAGILSTLVASAPQLIAGGVEMIAQLIVGFVESIPDIINQIPVLWESFKAEFGAVDWASLGDQLVYGLVNGITAAREAFTQAVTNLVNRGLSAAKSALGIASPSKVFANEVGKWIPPGMAVGIEANMNPLNTAMHSMTSAMTGEMHRASLAPSVAAATPASGRSEVNVVNEIKVSFEGDLAQLARVLLPHIRAEENRRGPQLIR